MPNINGTNKNDYLLGSASDDVIEGKRGDDWIEGGAGNDVLTGDSDPLHDPGRDTFVLRAGDGIDVVTDFQHDEDRLMLDSGTGVYDGILPPLGYLYDGQEIYNSHGALVVTVSAVDPNNDGIVDTQFLMPTGDAIILLGVAPSSLSSADIFGG